MANLVLWAKCGNWVQDRCVKVKRATTRLAILFARDVEE